MQGLWPHGDWGRWSVVPCTTADGLSACWPRKQPMPRWSNDASDDPLRQVWGTQQQRLSPGQHSWPSHCWSVWGPGQHGHGTWWRMLEKETLVGWFGWVFQFLFNAWLIHHPISWYFAIEACPIHCCGVGWATGVQAGQVRAIYKGLGVGCHWLPWWCAMKHGMDKHGLKLWPFPGSQAFRKCSIRRSWDLVKFGYAMLGLFLASKSQLENFHP